VDRRDAGRLLGRRSRHRLRDDGCANQPQRARSSSNLKNIRTAIESGVPHGRTNHGGAGDKGAWNDIPKRNGVVWGSELKARYDGILAKHPKLDRGNHANHLGTLGTGNHLIEVCLDEAEAVWFMLHSGSPGVGNRMGGYFIELARKDMRKFFVNLPDIDLAYFPEHTDHFDDYVEAVEWAQDYVRRNRDGAGRCSSSGLGRGATPSARRSKRSTATITMCARIAFR
jgi:RNA-splicing ligase RtcB